MGHLAVEGQAVAGLHGIQLVAVAVDQFTFEQMEELGAGVGEGRELFAGVAHVDHIGLEGLLRPAGVVEQVVGVALFGAAADHLHAFTGFDQQRAAALLVVLAEQLGHRHAEHVAQAAEGVEAGRHLGIFDLAEHALADPGNARHVGNFQLLRLALAFDLDAQVLLKLEAWLSVG